MIIVIIIVIVIIKNVRFSRVTLKAK